MMKIDKISIGRFGHWNQLELPLADSGLHIVYGPNEAGKSTLMRFLRGVLYGYKPEATASKTASRLTREPSESDSPSLFGGLRITRDGRAFEIERKSVGERAGSPPRGTLSVSSLDGGRHAIPNPEDWIHSLVGGTDEAVYERVFAVGLQELQELGTLQADQVARQIYGASLGPDGRRLLHACERYESERRALLGDDERGLLDQLSERHQAIQQELKQYASHRDRYDALLSERDELEMQVERLRSDQSETQRQFRGLELLAKAWEPWQQVDQLRRELKSLPNLRRFPEGGVERVRILDEKIDSTRKHRDRLRAEARELRTKFQATENHRQKREQGLRTLTLLEQRDWLKLTADRRSRFENREQQLKQEMDQKLAALGPAWNLKRLEMFDPNSQRQSEFFSSARNYERAARKRNRMRNQIKGWSRACRLKQAEVTESLKALDASNLEQAIREARGRRDDLKSLTALHLTAEQHEQREAEIRENLRTLQSRLNYPDWLPVLLWFFALGGLAASGLGFYQGFHQNGVAGLMWLLLGMTCGGLAWAVKNHYELAVQDTAEPLHEKRRRVESDLQQAEQSLQRLEKTSPWLKTFSGERTDDRRLWQERFEQSQLRLDQLEKLNATRQRILQRRQRLSGLRQKFLTVNREVLTTRQAWTDQLKKLGFPESTKVGDSLIVWQKLLEARSRWTEWNAASRMGDEERPLVQSYERRLDDAARGFDYKFPAGKSVVEKSTLLEERAKAFVQLSADEDGVQSKAREKRKAWLTASAELRKLRKERAGILRAAGARSRKELERRAKAFVRRTELRELLELAEAELQSVGESEKELAIVEDDLRAFHPDQHRARHAAIQKSLDSIELELRQAWERVGSIKQEIKTLEADQRSMEVRAGLTRVRQDWNAAVGRWCTVEAAGRALETLRSRYERNCQPETLAAASQWFGRLTQGRYKSIWTPLGQQSLRVEDGQGRSLGVDQLSSGTREQLFLAVRLALVRQMREQGVELPMILDDVLVNFDHERTEHAIETLRDFSSEGQQVLLFTCHRHVSEIGAAVGADSILLPARSQEFATASRHDERRAG